MSTLGYLCRELWQDPGLTQRQLAKRLSISLGKCNSLTKEAEELGYITASPETRSLTEAGMAFLEQYRVRRAVVLAAGVDTGFVPFSHETPKALMMVEGEKLIERVIRQLQERDIRDITVVVGYMAEMFTYLEDEFGVTLLYNYEYATKSSLSAVYRARRQLGNAYLVRGDEWLWRNIFHTYEPASWCACHWHEGPTHAWCVRTDGRRRIRSIRLGGRDKLALLGPMFFDEAFGKALRTVVEDAYRSPGGGTEPWESALKGRFDELALHANILPPEMVQSFATFEELRDFDTSYAEVSGSKNLMNIARIFDVPESHISGMTWLSEGMTNDSFVFHLEGEAYIYRIPGAGSENFISRRQEAAVYQAIAPLCISDEVVYIDPETGIKISKYYPTAKIVQQEDDAAVERCMQMLHRLHEAKIQVDFAFDVERKLTDYEQMCRGVDCIRFADFAKTRERVEEALAVIRESGAPKVLCHIDSVTNNFLLEDDGTLRLIDWEYAGMCHGVADVAMFGVFSMVTTERFDQLLCWYYGREPSEAERLLCFSYAAAAGLLWSLWAEFRQYYGEDFGEYAFEMYQIAKRCAKLVKNLRQTAA